jgi:hypothetical protein
MHSFLNSRWTNYTPADNKVKIETIQNNLSALASPESTVLDDDSNKENVSAITARIEK